MPGGVVDRGAHGRDDPVNWEILTVPYNFPVIWRTGDQFPTGTSWLTYGLLG
jgi:hypothetical protein